MRTALFVAGAVVVGALVGYAFGYAWERLIERPWIGVAR